MPLDFEKYAAKGNEFVRLVADDLGIPREKTGRIIRTVLHALRNRLSHEESFQLVAQLPVVLKGVYVEGWKFDKDFTRIHHVDDFLDEVRKEDGRMAGYDFGNNERAGKAVAAVFKALRHFISEGEFNDVMAVLSGEMKRFIKEAIDQEETIL